MCVSESCVHIWLSESKVNSRHTTELNLTNLQKATGKIEHSVHFLDLAELRSTDTKSLAIVLCNGDEWLLTLCMFLMMSCARRLLIVGQFSRS